MSHRFAFRSLHPHSFPFLGIFTSYITNAVANCTVVAILALAATTVANAQGTRPMDVVVNSSRVVLATSMGSDSLTQMRWTGSSWVRTYIDVGGKSWGIDLLSPTRAIVTLPFNNYMAELNWNVVNNKFEFTRSHAAPYYCTDVIKSNWPRRVFVANRGEMPGINGTPVSGAQEWQHAVYEIDVENNSGVIKRVLVTDREPRTLALSPDGKALFVSHIQGALGGPSNNAITGQPVGTGGDDPLARNLYDGGSIIMFNVSNGTAFNPVHRFLIGSPVRGLAVVPDVDDTEVPSVNYRLYFTHVGFGNAAEDPAFGGRKIPNVIGSIGFNASNNPVGNDPSVDANRQDVVINHAPDGADNVLNVLPERMAVRTTASGKELWVVNSGSGSVNRINLDAAGRIPVSGLVETMLFPIVTYGVPRENGGWLDDDNIKNSAGVKDFETASYDVASPTATTRVPLDAFDANPIGVALLDDAANESNDRIFVVSRLTHKLNEINPVSLANTPAALSDVGAAPLHERNFFGAGRGFDFREHSSMGPLQELPTNNITCGTCHVGGHVDGKIRFIVRNTAVDGPGSGGSPDNGSIRKVQADKIAKPVHVPSVFDIGGTEWIFIEGLKTIRDGLDLRAAEGSLDCGYCKPAVSSAPGGGFFFDTEKFTTGVTSPTSPVAVSGTLSPNQLHGRFLFEAMNCSRCHAGATVDSFARTTQDPTQLSFDPEFNELGQFGPTPSILRTENRLLADPTQIMFRSFTQGACENTVTLQRANVTNVGTRIPGDSQFNGINTPALAGAWDNRPYMHDGRYRTLDEVLTNTWVDTTATGMNRAADLVFEETPDNAFNDGREELPCDLTFSGPLFAFVTHKQTTTPPAGWQTVASYLPANDLADVKSFLRALSSQTDPCGGQFASSLIVNLTSYPTGACSTFVEWNTLIAMQCVVRYGPTSDPVMEAITPFGTHHEITIANFAADDYQATVIPRITSLCGRDPGVTESWTITSPCVTVAAAQSPVVPSPAGTGDVLVINVDFDDGAFSSPIAPSSITIGDPSGGDVVFHADPAGPYEADSSLTSDNGYASTVTIPYISGCAVAPNLASVPVYLGGAYLGSATVDIRSFDLALPEDGIINLSDVALFSQYNNKCMSDPGFSQCANFTVTDTCVNTLDFTLFGNHYGEQKPGGSSLVISTQVADARLAFTSPRPDNAESVTMEFQKLTNVKAMMARITVPEGTVVAARSDVPGLLSYQASSNEWLFALTSTVNAGGSTLKLAELGVPDGAITRDVIHVVEAWVVTREGTVEKIGDPVFTEGPRVSFTNELMQNHPNPFNPTTVIRFSIARDGHVSLRVYDVAGRLVRTLVNGRLESNHYDIEWDGRTNGGTSAASGVYFYRLDAPAFTATRKMVLLK